MAQKSQKLNPDQLGSFEQAFDFVKKSPEIIKQNEKIQLKLQILSQIVITHLAKQKEKINSSSLQEEIRKTGSKKQEIQTNDEDLEKLKSLAPEIALQIYLQIVTCLYPKEYLENFKIGVVYTQRKIIGTWKKRKLQINFSQDTINLIRFTKNKIFHKLSYSKSSGQWLGLKSNKYCFNLISHKESQQKNKKVQYLIGCDTQKEARNWFSLINLSPEEKQEQSKHPNQDSPNKMEQIKLMQSQVPGAMLYENDKGQQSSDDESFEAIDSADDEKKMELFQQLEGEQGNNEQIQERFQSTYQEQQPKFVEEQELEPLQEVRYEEYKMVDFSERVSSPPKLASKPQKQQAQKIEKKNEPAIPHYLTQSFQLTNDLNLFEENDYILIDSCENFRLLRHETQNQKYKVFLTLSFSFETVAQLFLQVHRIKHWNPLIEDFKVIKVIDSKQAVIYEKHKPQGYLYFSRDYVYHRSIFQKSKSEIYIVDTNSQQYQSSVANKWNTRRGQMKSQVIVLKPHPTLPGYTLLSITSNIDHGSKWFTTYQEQQFILHFLKAYQHLETFLIQQSFKKDNFKYFTLDIVSNEKEKINLNNNLTESAFINKYGQNNQQELQELKKLLEKLQGSEIHQVSNVFSNDKPQLKEDDYEGEQGKDFRETEKYDKRIDQLLENDDEQDLEQPEQFLEKNSQKRWDSNQVQYMLDQIQTGESTKKSIIHNYQLEQVEPSEPILQQSINGEHYAIPESIWEIGSKGGLIYIDPEGLKNQKKVIKLLVKQMGKNLLSGKSVINISMPVVVFSDSSVLGRLAECFVFAPNFFEKAGTLSNPLDQFKQVLAFNIAVLHFGIEQTKPFNPILGETFQAFINGAPLYMEQICHHPPISALQVYGKNYYMDGKWELAANMHTNSLTGKQIGLGHIKFLNNQTEIFFSRPATEISGLLWGQRVFNYAGKSILYDVQNQLYCELLFHAETSIFSKSQHPIDYFKGAIYKVKKQFVEQLNELSKSYKNIDKMHALFKPKEHVIDIIHEISGIWHKYLQIDDERIWDFYQEIPHVILHEKHPLPSDSIYRKDLIMWQSRNYENAQAAKEELENIQRADRKFRAKFVEKKKKHK